MDGITMGGGVGLSVHAPIRIATERTVFAMPETTIGLFPDVGGSFFLPRLDGKIGNYLALTSERLKGVNVYYSGIATHYIDSSTLPLVTSRLAELHFKDYDDLQTRLTTISSTINEFSSGLPPNEPPILVGPLRQAIDRTFNGTSIESIISALESVSTSSSPPLRSWATKILQTLSTRSPTSLKATLHLLALGAQWSISESFQREHILAGAFMRHPDFNAGVTARLIDKPPKDPEWTPASVSSVQDADIEAMFRPPPKSQRLELLGPTDGRWDYKTYPHHFGLPREEDIAEVVRQRGWTQRALVKRFEKDALARSGFAGGVKEKVQDVVARTCNRGDGDVEGLLEWVGDRDIGT